MFLILDGKPVPDTYLDQCLKDSKTMRWPDKAMPLHVYIAPFRWYEQSKQQESYVYQKLVLEAFDLWSQLSEGAVSFKLVRTLHESQIDLKWRRVDRRSLGHCEYNWNKEGMIFSAEIQIGITDGVLHAKYNNPGEVKHTIIHEVGHALGLIGHSTRPGDIMYVPHQYGVTSVSERDIETLKWLYKLPLGFNYELAAKQLNLPAPYKMDDVLAVIAGEDPNKRHPFNEALESTIEQNQAPENPDKLHEEHDFLSHQGRFFMETSNIESPFKRES